MARRPTPVLLFVKWVVAPILVALIGYFIVGPRIGKATPTPTSQQVENAAESSSPEPATKSGKDASSSPVSSIASPASSQPDVDIAVHKVKHAKKAHHTNPIPEDTNEVKVTHTGSPDDEPDQGGSAGATTAG